MFYNGDGTFNHGEVKLSVFAGGAWTISTIDPDAGEMNRCKTSIAVTDAAMYVMWKSGAGEWVIEDFPAEAPPEEEGMENPAEETAPEIETPNETGLPDAPDGTAAQDADASQDGSGEPPAETEATGGCGCRLAR